MLRTTLSMIAMLALLAACGPQRADEPQAAEPPAAETPAPIEADPAFEALIGDEDDDDTPPGAPGELQDTAWQWVSFHSGKEAFDIDHPERYTIAFEEDGRLAVRADCNRGSGTVYSSGPGAIRIRELATTRVLCPPESHYDLFVQSLDHAVLYFIQDGALHLERPVDSGTLRFEPLEAEAAEPAP